jgi:hypothetical protein
VTVPFVALLPLLSLSPCATLRSPFPCPVNQGYTFMPPSLLERMTPSLGVWPWCSWVDRSGRASSAHGRTTTASCRSS